MKRRVFFQVLVCVAVMMAGCMAEPKEEIEFAAKANNKFAFDLYSQIADKPTNTFFSPYSISSALMMVYAGAEDDTREQMAEVLRIAQECGESEIKSDNENKGNVGRDILSDENIHKSFGALMCSLNQRGKTGDFELVIANALWGQSGFELSQDFIYLVEENYKSEFFELDFSNESAARQRINTWVEKATRQKIKDLIGQGMLDELTRLVLTNAIYFKGKWQEPFDPKQTRKADFFQSDAQRVIVDMMNQTSRFRFTEGDGFSAIELAYAGDGLAMTIFLPDEIDGLPEFEQQLSQENFVKWSGEMGRARIQLSMPRFRIESKFNLTAPLKAMGMVDAFSEYDADFSCMSQKDDLYISDVVHKAFVEVNEEGTEAAAATGVTIGVTSIQKPPRVFRVDHPFIFLIHDKLTGLVLFAGRVENPAGN